MPHPVQCITFYFRDSNNHLVAKTAEEEFALVVTSPEDLDNADTAPVAAATKR
jgi:ethanolamine permease